MYCWYSYPILAAGIDFFFFSWEFLFHRSGESSQRNFPFLLDSLCSIRMKRDWGRNLMDIQMTEGADGDGWCPPLVMNNDHTAWFRYEFIGNKPLEKSMLPLSLHLPFL